MKKIFLVVFITLLALVDQITKLLIVNNIDLNNSVVIIKNFINFTYIKNYGVAFGMFNNLTYFVILITIVFFVILTKELRLYFNKKMIFISYCLVIGGLLGNLIDRIFLGFVRDFIDINFINFPIFNFSDIFIVAGTILLLIACFKMEGKSENDNNK